MSSKKKNKSSPKQDADIAAGSAGQDESETEMLIQREYDTLTDNLSTLKRRIEQLRRENEYLQNETDKTRMESKEYISFLSKRSEKRQNAIVTLSDQSLQELEELRRQRQNMQDEHEKQTNELKSEIMQKENELALLNNEITELRELKTLQQQQMCRIAELEKELTAMQKHHAESLVALKADLLKEMKIYEQKAEDKVQDLTISANKEASRCLMMCMKEIFEENQHLREHLKQLVQREHALRRQQELLQTQRQQLLLEREYVKGLHSQRFSPRSKTTISAGANTKKSPTTTNNN